MQGWFTPGQVYILDEYCARYVYFFSSIPMHLIFKPVGWFKINSDFNNKWEINVHDLKKMIFFRTVPKTYTIFIFSVFTNILYQLFIFAFKLAGTVYEVVPGTWVTCLTCLTSVRSTQSLILHLFTLAMHTVLAMFMATGKAYIWSCKKFKNLNIKINWCGYFNLYK